MKAAIMGCGLAGMSAAIFLQRRGIAYDIYDPLAEVGDFPARTELMLPIYSRPIWHLPKFIRSRYGLSFKPYQQVNTILFYSRGAKAQAVGRLGHIILRGRSDLSLDRQLFRQVSSKVNWGASPSLDELRSRYDWVIEATGEARDDTPGSRMYLFKGGLLRGRFQPRTVAFWHHSVATPGGYAYLSPLTSRMANIFVAVPESRIEPGHDFFVHFWDVLTKDLGYEPELLRREQFRKNLATQPPVPNDERIISLGSCLGSATPLLGMDPLVAFSSAFYGVGHICGEPGYQELVKHITGHLKRMTVIQTGMGNWSDLTYDAMLRLMTLGATPFFNCRLNLLSVLSRLLMPWIAPSSLLTEAYQKE